MCPDRDVYRRMVERWLTIAHVVKASADDVSWLYPDRSADDVLAEWSRRGPLLVTLTLGGDGAVAATAAGDIVRVPGVTVEVVDTIGAGDTFSAGLLHALDVRGYLDVEKLGRIDEAELASVLRFAVGVSAIACTRAGADPPFAHELDTAG